MRRTQPLLLDASFRALSDSELKRKLATYVESFSTLDVDRKNSFYNFFKDLLRKERTVKVSDIIKSSMIPIEKPDMNRALQVALLSTLEVFSNKLGIEKIFLQELLEVSLEACKKVSSSFEKTRRIDVKALAKYLADFGDIVSNKSITLERPIFLLFDSKSETDFKRSALKIREQVEASLAENQPPSFFHRKIGQLEQLVCRLQKYLVTSGGTEFVYTRGRRERLIYEKIEDMVLQCEQCFRIMMAYMSDETKILYGLVEKLKQLEAFQARMLLRFEDITESNQPNMAAVNDLREAIIRKAESKQQRDSMLRRLQVKYFRGDPSVFHRLHAKLFISDEASILAGSANLIPTSLESNVEAGFYSENPYLVKDGINFFEKVWGQCY